MCPCRRAFSLSSETQVVVSQCQVSRDGSSIRRQQCFLSPLHARLIVFIVSASPQSATQQSSSSTHPLPTVDLAETLVYSLCCQSFAFGRACNDYVYCSDLNAVWFGVIIVPVVVHVYSIMLYSAVSWLVICWPIVCWRYNYALAGLSLSGVGAYPP